MSCLFFLLPQAPADTGPTLSVSPSTAYVSGTKTGADAYAGISFASTGEEFKTDADGNSAYDVSRGDWLDVGTAAEVWIEVTITGGSLGSWNSEDSGSSRIQLSTDAAAWRIVRSTTGLHSTIADFDFYDASSGGNLLASVTLQFTANKEL